ncbi:Por secretion system C-terminal sorting domain-containing protein, partial [Flexibacter flexilis DSM 6793]
APLTVTATPSATAVRFDWPSYTTNTYMYQIHYRVQGTSTWYGYQSTGYGAPTLAARVTGLTPNTTYEWRVRNACLPVAEDWNEWSSISTFTTGAARLGQELAQLSVYPNPTTGLVNVAGLSGAVNYVVYNSVGKQVLSGEQVVSQEAVLQLDLSAYPQGAYILKVMSAEGVATRQMILTGK